MKKQIELSVRVANNFLDIISTCDRNIDANIQTEYFKSVKKEAQQRYINAVSDIAEYFAKCLPEKFAA